MNLIEADFSMSDLQNGTIRSIRELVGGEDGGDGLFTNADLFRKDN